MKTAAKILAPLAVLAVTGTGQAVAAFAAAAGAAADSAGTSYQASLAAAPLSGQAGATGSLTLTLDGDRATIHEQVSGLGAVLDGAAYPHLQHIHGGGMGTCAPAAADTNGDGVISAAEGMPYDGAIQTTLSVSGDTSAAAGTDTSTAPTGASYTYDRTITLDAATLDSIRKGIAVIEVHGLDPATAPKAASTEKSELIPSLPLAATAPVLCGQLVATPLGAAATGDGASRGLDHTGALEAAGGLLAAAGALLLARRRRSAAR